MWPRWVGAWAEGSRRRGVAGRCALRPEIAFWGTPQPLSTREERVLELEATLLTTVVLKLSLVMLETWLLLFIFWPRQWLMRQMRDILC